MIYDEYGAVLKSGAFDEEELEADQAYNEGGDDKAGRTKTEGFSPFDGPRRDPNTIAAPWHAATWGQNVPWVWSLVHCFCLSHPYGSFYQS